MKKQKRGITLIALVLTIIVLLILAAVAISLALGQNGLLAKSRAAQTEQIRAEIKDLVSSEEAAARAKWETEADKSSTTEQNYIEEQIETAMDHKGYTIVKTGQDAKMEFQKDAKAETSVKYTLETTTATATTPAIVKVTEVANF